MKQRVRLTENDLHRIIAESVKKVLNEWDEYNEFDRNGDAGDMSPSYESSERLRIKMLKEPYSKKNEQMLIKYLKEVGWENSGELYDDLGDKYPNFKRAWENDYSWATNNDLAFLPSSEETRRMMSYGTDLKNPNKPANAYTAREHAAWLGARGGVKGHGEDNRHKNPANVRNINTYDSYPKGKYAMAALDPYNDYIGKTARSTAKETYDTAKRMYYRDDD